MLLFICWNLSLNKLPNRILHYSMLSGSRSKPFDMHDCNLSDFAMFLELNIVRMIAMLLVVKFHESIKQEAKFTWNMQRALNMCFHVAVLFFVVYRSEDEELEVCDFTRE